jgi:tetratricopeptide (TPR) repeat protein
MVPSDIRREIEAADTAASDRRRVAIAAHQQALERHGQSATADTAAEVERTRAVAHAAHQEYTHDGRHVTGRHNAAMLRWAAAIAAQREHAAAPLPPGPADSTRAQANQAAVAANEAYREGDLDRARQFTDRAAALDPSRAELWQQHRQQIAARRLILDAKVAYAEGDRQRAQALLGDARQLDPRMPAIWDGDLPATRAFDMAEPGPGGNTSASQASDQEAGPGHRATATPSPANGEAPKPQWPSSPARSEPSPAPAARQEPAGRQQLRAAAETESGGNTGPERSGALSADWRDQVLSEARQPWQPAPGWPHNPALHRPPEAGNPGAGIELSEPTPS